MKLSCLVSRHQRSASRVWIDGFNCRSVCRHCGTPLIRTAPRTWLPLRGRLADMVAAR